MLQTGPIPELPVSTGYADTISIAPMMDYTDRHFRYLLRVISRRVLLYTEMITTGAILHGDCERFLRHDPFERPLVAQLGGSDPCALAQAAVRVEEAGYDGVNLNVGCPSGRVQKGRIGACLMADPGCVADCVRAMSEAVSIPVTVKTRTGIDELDSFEHLAGFVRTVADAGCGTFIIHARKAILQGLSPKENRTVPPLQYDRVYDLKRKFPDLRIILNGGIMDWDAATRHMRHVDGVMIGREACRNPYLLAQIDARFYNDCHPVPSREEIVSAYIPYMQSQRDAGVSMLNMARHLFGLYHARPHARRWRRELGELARANPADASEILRQTIPAD